MEDLQNLPQIFFRRAGEHPRETALHYDFPFREMSWQEFAQQVEEIAGGLLALGVQPGERVGILSRTCMEWTACDLAIMSIGAITTTFYPTCTSEEIRYIIDDCLVKVLFVEDSRQLQKTQQSSPKGTPIICYFEGTAEEQTEQVYSLEELREKGKAQLTSDPQIIEKCYQQLGPDSPATIVYTSGTSGPPKGVLLNQRNILSQIRAINKRVPLVRNGQKPALLAFLTAAHIFQRIGSWCFLSEGCPVYYCPRIERLVQYLGNSQAEVVLAVPLVLEKIRRKIELKIAELSPGWRQKLVSKALQQAISLVRAELQHRSNPLQRGYLQFLRGTVLEQIRQQLSPTLRLAVCGGAPISEDLLLFFEALGIRLLEGYGLTETTAVLCANSVESIRAGSVGKPLAGIELQIAEDGEVLARGPVIFQGYWNKEAETAGAFTAEGFFRTGDIGRFDQDGNLLITDRKKDLIITAGGKNVAPAAVENTLLKSPYLEQIAVFGDNQKWLVALLTLNQEAVRRQLTTATEEDWEKLILSEMTHELVRAELERHGTALPEHERIRRFRILPEPFSQEKGELTHTMKLKRRVIQNNYAAVIEELYRIA